MKHRIKGIFHGKGNYMFLDICLGIFLLCASIYLLVVIYMMLT